MYKIGTAGMIPKKVAEYHVQNVQMVISQALAKAGVKPEEIEGIGYTKGPGIGNCLQVGQIAAKTMAKKLKMPIAPVNHGIGHIEIARVKCKNERPACSLCKRRKFPDPKDVKEAISTLLSYGRDLRHRNRKHA